MGNRGITIRLPIPPVQLESRGRKWWQHLGWLLSVSLLVACSQEEMLQKFTSPEEQAVAKKYIDQLRNRDFDEIEKAAAPSIVSASLEGTLKTMADLLPADPPVSVRLVGAHRMSSTSGTVVSLTFEYQFRERFVLANVATKTNSGVISIVGLHVQPESGSLESQNRFTLGGKSALQYGVLASAVVAALFTLCVLVVCIRTKLKRRKWLWILFILFGFGKLSVNWATGQLGIQLLAAQLLSASTHADFFGPWIISVSLPVGAVVFLLLRRTLRAEDAVLPGGSG
jgi:hypothetical protein